MRYLPKTFYSNIEFKSLNSFLFENLFVLTNDILYRQYIASGNKIKYRLINYVVDSKFFESSFGASYSNSGGGFLFSVENYLTR